MGSKSPIQTPSILMRACTGWPSPLPEDRGELGPAGGGEAKKWTKQQKAFVDKMTKMNEECGV
jgi:hypothetical protein